MLFSFFREIGLSEKETDSLLDKNPTLISTSLDRLRARVLALQSVGINDCALYRLVIKYPNVLIAEEIDSVISFVRDDLEGKVKPSQLERLFSAKETRFLLGFDQKVKLLLHHEIPHEKIAHVLNNVNLIRAIGGKSVEEIERTIAFLKPYHGIELIVRRPAILNYDLDSQLIPKIQFLEELSGGDKEATGTVLRKLPAILSYRLEHMEGHVECLRSYAGLSDPEIFKIILVFPSVMSASKERKLRPRTEFLKQCGLNSSDIFKFLTRAPLFLGLSFKDNLAHKLGFLVKIGYEYRTKELAVAMGAVTRTSCENMQKVIGLFLSYGLSCEDIFAMSKKHPQILQYNPRSLEEKMEYLIEEIGREVSELLIFPAFLGYKLDDRIKHSMATGGNYAISHQGQSHNSLQESLKLVMMYRMFNEILLGMCFWHASKPLPVESGDRIFMSGCVTKNSSSKESKILTKTGQVYIVYMGKRQHPDVELLTRTHHQMLATVLGSEETSKDSMVYSYKHGFSGFAAKMTEAQAHQLSKLPGVVHVTRNQFYKPQTTRSWDYLGLSSNGSPSNLLHKSKRGNGVIIGLLDTGIWPELEVFNDEGLGPIPSRWKGVCESGESFDGEKACNRKLIGARYFIRGLEAAYGQPYNSTQNDDVLSPRDSSGHGTHTSSIAGGSFVANASYHGLGLGTVRGGAPAARLAMYKVCWRLYDAGVCADADVLKAFDEAIRDGVDVLSVSLAADIPLYSEVDQRSSISIGSFHAVAKGITVVCAAGNAGPRTETVQNTAPWILTVAASTVDRSFPTPILLGNNQTIMGQAMFTGEKEVAGTLIYPEVSDLMVSRNCESLSSNDDWMAGKVVLCFASEYNQSMLDDAIESVKDGGAKGVIVARSPRDYLYSYATHFPCVQVSYETGTQILYYIRSTSNPQVMLRPSRTHIGKPVSTNVAYFSSRGPSSNAPAILKPDIAAPGVKILAAIPPFDQPTTGAFAFLSGTSMATPHVSGIVALLKSLYPDWSSAAIKSAIVTTALTADQSGGSIFAEGEPPKLADPFDFGGGIVNPNSAADPGLVYDMDTEDYVQYLCAMGYNDSAILQLTEHPIVCPSKQPSILDVNLPSITIPSLKKPTTLTRTVTNVGPVNSKYKAIVEFASGINISVRPETLSFNSRTKTISFSVTISSAHNVNAGYYFGSLTWTDGMHVVRSPISVRTEVGESFL
ncbi:hypothetical protein COLO4_14369 [Corchorus olitorius]|uniref:Peptidase S8/S53 domain-containing protein n=1 Tax=Corchorus olitorius TaxID=93759 RepID=A0A1R3JSN0_9ROSI|nr:hypothetical protein COLO4_14369 [Corchorus olitorius]